MLLKDELANGQWVTSQLDELARRVAILTDTKGANRLKIDFFYFLRTTQPLFASKPAKSVQFGPNSGPQVRKILF
jgi:hypothetical protein